MPPIAESPVGVIDASCYRQVEGAGILTGTDREEEAQRLVDFLLSTRFQEDVPLSMFVFPVDPLAGLPPEFEQYAVVVGEGADERLRSAVKPRIAKTNTGREPCDSPPVETRA